ncbi:hypothetical protein FALBO_14131 [Fusarium albosuccineum]|uniref:Uncharacterized protein n=1 Tax=Fusarium albosuccineum TaxID=1237068 RepID=A0A8H4KZU0_9HYPO|nr:hypothetical protein FALBO_14131 [Fusarium albosuccineum]
MRYSIYSIIQLLLLSNVVTASPSRLRARDDMCYFEDASSPVGAGNANCAGSNGKPHEDKLQCPSAPGTEERICGRDDVNPEVRDNCKAIDGTASYCTTGGELPNGGHHFCYCVNGNFCCTQGAEVPGGDSPVDYYKGAGCNCGAEV